MVKATLRIGDTHLAIDFVPHIGEKIIIPGEPRLMVKVIDVVHVLEREIGCDLHQSIAEVWTEEVT